MLGLDRAKDLATREGGLAVAITSRADGSARASVVNAGVLDHPVTEEQVIGFVSRGAVRKLDDLRHRRRATLVFRSGWEWVAVEGRTTLVGPDDNADGLDESELMAVVRQVYAAAVGGTPEQWLDLDETMAAERHTVVLISPERLYPTAT